MKRQAQALRLRKTTKANQPLWYLKHLLLITKVLAKLVKIDQQKNALAGAEFKVTDAETGQTVARSLRSDNQGLVQVNHLQPGKIYLCGNKSTGWLPTV